MRLAIDQKPLKQALTDVLHSLNRSLSNGDTNFGMGRISRFFGN
ncbi:MAG: hypothetical protein AAGD25_25390 [Cyanobacteria bacterium P01_F01_bin.150]